MSIPFRCENGHVFISDAITGDQGDGNKIYGNKVRCKCGAIATNIGGDYSHRDGKVSAVSNVDPADLADLLAILRDLQAGTISQAEAFERAEKVSPRLRDSLAKWMRDGLAPAVIISALTTGGVGWVQHKDAQTATTVQHSDAQRAATLQQNANSIMTAQWIEQRRANDIAAAAASEKKARHDKIIGQPENSPSSSKSARTAQGRKIEAQIGKPRPTGRGFKAAKKVRAAEA